MRNGKANIAIIPARGGSKRIPGKNIKNFSGKPIISYSIQAALNSNLFDEIMVSTDDEQIASVAKEFGAHVPFYRSKETSDDFATTIDVLLEVYNEYLKKGTGFTNVCCIYACAPFVSATQLSKAYNLLIKHSAETIFPIIQYGHPIQRALGQTGDFIKMIDKNNLTVRTQDLPARFHDAGQFYWLTTEVLLTHKKLITDKTIGMHISELEAHDIDNEMDWKLAELKFDLLQKEKYIGFE